MRKTFWLIFLFVILGAAAVWLFILANKKNEYIISSSLPNTINKSIMKITSPKFENNQNIPPLYTCDGQGVNPPLEFSNVLKEAKSLALILHDPDAPLAGGWTHWILWDINPGVASIAENSVPAKATQGKTSSGQNNYGGPCPPTSKQGDLSGIHHYQFKLFALDIALKDLPSYSEKGDLEAAMNGHILEQAVLVGLYSRVK